MRLQPGEPTAGPWRSCSPAELTRVLLGRGLPDRRAVVAVDGRSGAGKTTLAESWAATVPSAAVLHTDDFAWNEPLFEWGGMLRGALLTLQTEGRLSFTPPVWAEHGRTGSIEVAPECRLVVIEGAGASQRAVADLLDAAIWMQSDDDLAEERGIRRDIESGVNGGPEGARAVWNSWMAQERPFFEGDRPWERATIVVAGTPTSPLAHECAVVYAPGPLIGVS